eukprot:TRINITY_DN2868_c0_g1_i2.p1 TRINITY_DN2868_c0_g1~~TRINITY_DN2868_c0_g1_i2.p1  ORF type:complete len:362 (-),score=75.47 TRINITY_DN2868_c0_g1_i2:32-1117(-)
MKSTNVISQFFSSYEVTMQTLDLLVQITSQCEWKNASDLNQIIKHFGKKLIDTKPWDPIISNAIKRVLYIIREDYNISTIEETDAGIKQLRSSQAAISDIGNLLLKRHTSKRLDINRAGIFRLLGDKEKDDFSQSYTDLQERIIESINLVIQEVESIYEFVAEQALTHIHTNEVIMTIGHSRCVEALLKEAAENRKFQVIVAESMPSYAGRKFAGVLAGAGIETTLIHDSAIHTMMARVNKVIVGTHAVLANGGLMAMAGTHILAQAAKYHSVPVIVCTGLYKLSPIYPSQDSFAELNSPSDVLNFEEVAGDLAHVRVINPAWDYIPPDLLSLYITNSGSYMPAYIYRLLAEYYHPDDDDI